MFQFPTGWNSNVVFVFSIYAHAHSFNSQRDGILQTKWLSVASCNDSFNSQRDGILHGNEINKSLHLFLFQFPTGWNSTTYSSHDLDGYKVFQFPTGWNSTLLFWRWRCYFRVSIPNGMEFYDMFEGGKSIPKLFQFPTGWNSTIP